MKLTLRASASGNFVDEGIGKMRRCQRGKSGRVRLARRVMQSDAFNHRRRQTPEAEEVAADLGMRRPENISLRIQRSARLPCRDARELVRKTAGQDQLANIME